MGEFYFGEYFPFYIPFSDSTLTEVDLSYMNDEEAGKNGFLQVDKDGHYFFSDYPSQRIRFFGSQCFLNNPSHKLAEKISKKFSKLGFNLWKWGALELFWNKYIGTDKWNDEIDRFDYLFYQMKIHGIYCYAQIDEYGLILPSIIYPGARDYYKIDGIDSFPEKGVTKVIQYIMEPSLFSAEKKYWSDLFLHKNPYTGLEYREDPSIVFVEITNENYILKRWEYWKIDYNSWPYLYRKRLDKLWNNWLEKQYTSTNEIEEKWKYKKRRGLLKGEFLGNIKFFPLSIKGNNFSPGRKEDMALFLFDLQNTYFDSVSNYLKSIGIKALIIRGNGNQLSIPCLYTAYRGDGIDSHVYYNHPTIIGKNGMIKNSNPFKINTSIISPVASNSVSGKPVCISEINWSFPSEHQYLFLPFVSSYASFQDWDIIILHAFCNSGTPGKKYIEQQLIIGNNPLVITQIPVASLIFRMELINTDSITYFLDYPDIWNEYLHFYNLRFPPLNWSMSPDFIPLAYKFRKILNGTGTNFHLKPLVWRVDTDSITSTTGELTFDRKSEIFIANNERVKVIAGRLGRKKMSLGDINVSFGNSPKYGGVYIVSLDGKELENSSRILIIDEAHVKNSNSRWEIPGKKFLRWGGPPVLVEVVQCNIEWNNFKKNVEIWALDEHGRKKRKVKYEMDGDKLVFSIGKEYQTLWYEIWMK